jgi:hypothetical protein
VRGCQPRSRGRRASFAAVVRDYYNPELASRDRRHLVDATLESAQCLAELRALFPDGILEPAEPPGPSLLVLPSGLDFRSEPF